MLPTQLKRRNPVTGKNEHWNPNTFRFEEEENPFPHFPGYSPNFPSLRFNSSTNENDVQVANFMSHTERYLAKIKARNERELEAHQTIQTTILSDPGADEYMCTTYRRGFLGIMFKEYEVVVRKRRY